MTQPHRADGPHAAVHRRSRHVTRHPTQSAALSYAHAMGMAEHDVYCMAQPHIAVDDGGRGDLSFGTEAEAEAYVERANAKVGRPRFRHLDLTR